MDLQPVDPDDMPLHIRLLYDKPQGAWSSEDWRALALYLFDELKASRRSAERATKVAEESLSQIRRLMAYAKVVRSIERALKAGTLTFRDGHPNKPRGAPKKYTSEQHKTRKVVAVVLAARLGPTKAAHQLAVWQLEREGKNPTTHQAKTEAYAKSWANRISNYRQATREEIWAEHGPGLAFIGQLMDLGLYDPTKPRRKVRRTPKKS